MESVALPLASHFLTGSILTLVLPLGTLIVVGIWYGVLRHLGARAPRTRCRRRSASRAAAPASGSIRSGSGLLAAGRRTPSWLLQATRAAHIRQCRGRCR